MPQPKIHFSRFVAVAGYHVRGGELCFHNLTTVTFIFDVGVILDRGSRTGGQSAKRVLYLCKNNKEQLL